MKNIHMTSIGEQISQAGKPDVIRSVAPGWTCPSRTGTTAATSAATFAAQTGELNQMQRKSRLRIPQIGIVIGITSAYRFSERAAGWLAGFAQRRDDVQFEILDLYKYPLPCFGQSNVPVPEDVGYEWQAKLESLDGFVIVSGDYDHGIPAMLKGMLDCAHKEFARKPVAFVGYGDTDAAQAIAQRQLVFVDLQMVPMRKTVHVTPGQFMDLMMHGRQFSDFPLLGHAAMAMLNELAWWTCALQRARNETWEP